MRTTPRILDQISGDKTKDGERLARLEADRATVTAQLTDLEAAERVLTRVSKTPARRTKSATAAAAKVPTASRGGRRTSRASRATVSKAAGRGISAPSLGERILTLATGRTRQELYLACPNDRPNHVGIAVQRHIRAGRIQERDGKLYAASPAAHATT
ncbi:MAG: hypothetical protein JOZ11_04600 [Alphaproteobacteria bacterium]|nr:hypothetical protein [Alphaproteobacteria bacterium]